jgi:hypothetical protein
MKHGNFAALVLAGVLAMGGCATNPAADVCGEVRTIENTPAALALINAQPPTSAIGVVWADLKSACSGGSLKPGVGESWASQVLQDLLALAPSLIALIH